MTKAKGWIDLADNVQIICADCREHYDAITHDEIAIITDPPYGIDLDRDYLRLPDHTKFDKIEGDNETPNLKTLFELASRQRFCIWGANMFPDQLPSRGRWICWDKRCGKQADKMMGSPFELAWTNRDSGFDSMFRLLHGGVVNADGGKRVHKTQKPVELMAHCIDYLRVEGGMVADPYMGSGSTGIAAIRRGIGFIGIEKNPAVFEVARARLEDELRRPRLELRHKPATQMAMDLGHDRKRGKRSA